MFHLEHSKRLICTSFNVSRGRKAISINVICANMKTAEYPY